MCIISLLRTTLMFRILRKEEILLILLSHLSLDSLRALIQSLLNLLNHLPSRDYQIHIGKKGIFTVASCLLNSTTSVF